MMILGRPGDNDPRRAQLQNDTPKATVESRSTGAAGVSAQGRRLASIARHVTVSSAATAAETAMIEEKVIYISKMMFLIEK